MRWNFTVQLSNNDNWKEWCAWIIRIKKPNCQLLNESLWTFVFQGNCDRDTLLPASGSLTSSLGGNFFELKEKVRAYLDVGGSNVSITTDYWWSSNWIPFLVVTARWINPDWTSMKAAVLDFRKVDTEHTGLETKEVLPGIIDEFNIRNKVSGAPKGKCCAQVSTVPFRYGPSQQTTLQTSTQLSTCYRRNPRSKTWFG